MSEENTGYVNKLDGQTLVDAITVFSNGIETYNTIRTNVEKTSTALFETWRGKGRQQFETDYLNLYQQLEDISDIMYELYDLLVEASAAYTQADEETAKAFTMQ